MPSRVIRIEKADVVPVYNMEVDEYHNFAVNGGHIVHNCCDELRYAHNHFAKRYHLWGAPPTVRKKPRAF